MNKSLKRGVLAALLITTVGSLFASEAEVPLPNPLGLKQALNYALEHNPGLLSTKEQIREREGVLIEARSKTLPSVSSSASYTRTDSKLVSGPTGTALADDRDWSASVVVKQILYAGGSIRAGVKAQKEQAEAARLAYAAAVNDTVLLVTQRFDAVLLAREIVVVREEAVTLAAAELERAKNRRDAGASSDFEVLRAEVTLANAKPALIRARNDYRVSQEKLKEVLGAQELLSLSDGKGLELLGDLSSPGSGLPLVDALAQAKVKRPELLRQEHLGKASEQAVTVAKAGYQPTVAATGGYAWQKASWSRKASDSLDGWTAGIQADWAIFDGRATAGKVIQARSQQRQVKHGTDSLALSVAVEVRQAHSLLVEATELLAASEKVVEQALESLRLAEVKNAAGSVTQLDVLQAQTALTEARSNLASARHDRCVALATLARAIGNGLDS